ncbi:MAG: hypothetical protein AAGF98_16450 [Cyanobacteria bacterium P01_H01_bin.153]
MLPDSRTEFYQESTRILLDQWQGKFNQYKAINKRSVLQHLALFSQTGTQRAQKDRRRMDRSWVLQKTHRILPSLNLAPEAHSESILNEIVERSGLLLVVDGGEGYQFSHLTLQEYFAAEALKEDAKGLFNRFSQAPDEWREVVKLWCGFGRDSTKLIQAVAQIDIITGFECLADAQKIDPNVANAIIEPFKAQLGTQTSQQERVISAFGAVAANARPRGKAIFAFLRRLLNSPQELTRTQAAEALSKTNHPHAATLLGRYYRHYPEIRAPLIDMGDLAVSVLREIGKQIPTALEDLFTIGTPDAASALAFFLWQGNAQQQKAAWYLASLLPQLGIEAALRTCPYAIEVRNIQTLDWIWQPFAEPADSTLPLTVGRIARLISNTPYAAIPSPLPRLDPRLITPLCAIHLRNQVKLPTHWPLSAEALREQQTQLPGMNEQIEQMVNTLIAHNPPDARWRRLFSGLPPKLQLDLLHRLIVYRPASKDNWCNVFRIVKYEFRTCWQYCCVLLIATAASVLAIIAMGTISRQYSDNVLVGFLGLAVVVVLAFWESLRRGIEKPFEPNTFLRLGLLGPVTFRIELRQLFQNQLVWPGIEPLFSALSSAVAVAVTVAIASATAGTGVGTVSFILGVVFAVAVADAIAGTGTISFAGAVYGAVVFAVSFAGTIAVVFAVVVVVAIAIVFAVAVADYFAIAIAVAIAGAIAGAGLGAWYRLKSRSDARWLKFFAFLAFPWFCWFPIVMVFSTWGLHHFFSLTWLSAISFNILILSLCSGLWWDGRQREARARNPLQGILQSTP